MSKEAKSKLTAENRKSNRRQPDLDITAQIDLHLTGEFKCERVALVVDHSIKDGCGLAMLRGTALRLNEKCRVMVGTDLRYGKVVWRRVLDDSIVRLGLEYFVP